MTLCQCKAHDTTRWADVVGRSSFDVTLLADTVTDMGRVSVVPTLSVAKLSADDDIMSV